MNRLLVAKELIAVAKELTAMYWGGRDRIYRLTRKEQQNGTCGCPKCKAMMEKQPFTRSEKIYVCPLCGFKVPTDKVVTERVFAPPQNVYQPNMEV